MKRPSYIPGTEVLAAVFLIIVLGISIFCSIAWAKGDFKTEWKYKPKKKIDISLLP